jgi:hypothetical protein
MRYVTTDPVDLVDLMERAPFPLRATQSDRETILEAEGATEGQLAALVADSSPELVEARRAAREADRQATADALRDARDLAELKAALLDYLGIEGRERDEDAEEPVIRG